ncbi:PQQ-binding-like beta-propeller repeat protein [Actinokineospora auranticolor]|uniref:Putative pyrroloquinoline-quinone binding quinoprotein n=1 Tax=Actinokineospora auranticolor TaxID=155976 RepID=A0A2S6GN86_9PSEU|nr:PQQ-binding-like beta-propeller repeat protein [Actinokineospora auranticolor]PPK66688.1 putative pyrroloquinoline-quinone binding quinoprotein [Actinokineospora auranticolor]
MRTVAVVLALLLMAAGCTSESPGVPDAPDAPRLAAGLAWQTEVWANGYAVVGGTVFAGRQSGLTAVDARTGRTVWRFRSPEGMNVTSWSVTGGAVTVAMDTARVTEPGAEYDWSTIGLDAATGEQRWDDDRAELLPSNGHFGPEYSPLRLAAGAGVVVTPTYDDSGNLGLAGVDARTGSLAWDRPFAGLSVGGFSGCAVTDRDETLLADDPVRKVTEPLVASDDDLAVVVAQCAQGRAVLGFDPRTGEPRWATPLPPERPKFLVMDRRAILVTGEGAGTVLTSDGRAVFAGRLPAYLPVMAVVGTTAVVSGIDGTDDPLVAVDLGGRGVLWSQPRPSGDLPTNTLRRNAYQSMAVAGGAVLGYRASPGGTQEGLTPLVDLLPVAVDRIDPATGSTRSAPLAVVGGGAAIGVVDNRLLIASGMLVTAVELAPDGSVKHGNAPAPPDRWPDPCDLLTPDYLARSWPARPPKPVGTPGTLLGAALPRPLRCVYTDLDGSAPAMVSVRWTAADPADAAALAAGLRVESGDPWSSEPLKPLVPDVGTWAIGDGAVELTVHTGPVIVDVHAEDLAVPAVQIGKAVTARLQELGYR